MGSISTLFSGLMPLHLVPDERAGLGRRRRPTRGRRSRLCPSSTGRPARPGASYEMDLSAPLPLVAIVDLVGYETDMPEDHAVGVAADARRRRDGQGAASAGNPLDFLWRNVYTCRPGGRYGDP